MTAIDQAFQSFVTESTEAEPEATEANLASEDIKILRVLRLALSVICDEGLGRFHFRLTLRQRLITPHAPL